MYFLKLLICTTLMLSFSVSASVINGSIQFLVSYQNMQSTDEPSIFTGVDFGDILPFPVIPDGIIDNDASTGMVLLSSGSFLASGIEYGDQLDLWDFSFDLNGAAPLVASIFNYNFYMESINQPEQGDTSFNGSGLLLDTLNSISQQASWSFQPATNNFSVVILNTTAIPLLGSGVFLSSGLLSLFLFRRGRYS